MAPRARASRVRADGGINNRNWVRPYGRAHGRLRIGAGSTKRSSAGWTTGLGAPTAQHVGCQSSADGCLQSHGYARSTAARQKAGAPARFMELQFRGITSSSNEAPRTAVFGNYWSATESASVAATGSGGLASIRKIYWYLLGGRPRPPQLILELEKMRPVLGWANPARGQHDALENPDPANGQYGRVLADSVPRNS